MQIKAKRSKLILLGSISIFSVLAILLIFYTTQGREVGVKENTKETAPISVPQFTTESVDGKTFNFEQLRGKKSLIVTSIATWCGSCIQNNTNLKQAIKEKNISDIEVIAISIDPWDDKEKLLQYQNDVSLWSWYILKRNAGEPKVIDIFNIQTVDESYIINKEGKVIESISGLKTLERWKKLIENH